MLERKIAMLKPSVDKLAVEKPFCGAGLRLRGAFVIAGLLAIGLSAFAWWYLRLPVGGRLLNDTISEPLREAERAVLELDLGAGHLQLGADSLREMLLGKVQTLEGFETFTRTTTAEDGAMVYRLLSDVPAAVREPVRWPEWTLRVNPEVPIKLHVRGGMGESDLDLSKLNLTDFSLEAQTGRYTVSFPEQGNVNAAVKRGTGRTTLLLPAGVAFELTMQTRGAGHIEFDGRVYRTASSFTSPDYETAENRLELSVTSGLANVVIARR